MIDLGFPYVRGYQPRFNYQSLLAIVAEEQVRGKTTLDQAALSAVQQPAVVLTQSDFTKVKSEPPKKQHSVRESLNPLLFRAEKRDYLEREARNRSLGLAGEEFVVQLSTGALSVWDSLDPLTGWSMFQYRKVTAWATTFSLLNPMARSA